MATDNDLTRLLALNDGMILARALQLAAELGVADLLAEGPRRADDLAAVTSTHPDALYRLLRTLASCGVFTEVQPGHFGLTPVGAYLRDDHPASIRSFVRWGDVLARVLGEAAYSLRTGAAAFDRAFGESFFDYVRSHPDRGAVFDKSMAELSAQEDAAVADAYDFTATRSIVDVGGGLGSLLRIILAGHPEMTGTLLDQPPVVQAAQELMNAAGLADRCVVTAGDFFQEVSSGADTYLLKSVVHDWPDAQAVTILDNCRTSMSRDGKLLLVERVIPVGDAPHPSKAMDFAMLVLLGGRERTATEYAGLLADAGFRISRIVETASAMSVIEAVPDPGE